MEYWAQHTVSPFDGRVGWTVVDDRYDEHVRAGEYLRVIRDGDGRSVGTARTYAGRLALYLTWAATAGVDETAVSVEQLAAFARWLERSLSRKHRPGASRRRAVAPNVVPLAPARSPATVDGILTVAVEFLRFAASRGWAGPAGAEALSTRVELRYLPPGFDPGERRGRPVVTRRRVRRRRVERPPATLTCDQVGALVDACANARDRFVVEALYATGLRAGELCGLHLSDLHLLPSAVRLGCPVAGAHLHVVRREDNENGALAKSVYPRVVPVCQPLVWCHDAYRLERDNLAEATASDYLLVNLWRPPLGRGLRPAAVDELFARLSGKAGFYARPHMLRHSFASELGLATKDPALVKELLGHASLTSTEVGLPDVETWLASGPGTPARQRWVSEQECTVGGDAGGCPRPGAGARGLCHAHDVAWAAQHRAGKDLAGFLASATPLPGFGGCLAASCYLAAAHAKTRLCEIHYRIWRDDGSPAGQRFPVWAAGVRQPANGRVLSLRGLPELVRLELLYAVGCRVQAQIRTGTGNMRGYVDQLRSAGVTSVLDYDLRCLDADGNHDYGRFARFAADRVHLAYGDAGAERGKDTWDLRVFGRSGHLDFTPIRQDWLREVARAWAGAALVRVRSKSELQHRVQSVSVLSRVLASGPGGGADPAALGRADAERFLLRVRSAKASTGRPYSPRRAAGIVEDLAFVIREARDLGLLADLGPTFAFRRRDGGPRMAGDELGKALPPHVVAALDAELGRLRAVPGSSRGPSHHGLGVLTERAGETAVLACLLLKGTGRRVGEVASLHLDCLGLDEHAKPVLVYDNHKAARMGRRLPLADTALVETIRSQQAWVTGRFPGTPREALWLLPRANKNADGRAHLPAHQILMWMRSWVAGIPRLDAGGTGQAGEPVPFDRRAVHPHAFRHTYAQSLADSGVAPSVLRDLMDHRSLSTTLGYYRVGEARKRAAMELLARHTIDNRGTARPVQGPASRAGQLREELSWVAVPMGKCAEPANVRAGGGACPIRYQCAACPHFESDPSFLPELRGYADDLRREREAMLAAGAADWVVANVTRQLDVITSHIHTHQGVLDRLPGEQRAMIEEASATVRHVRRAVPVAFGPTRRRDQQ